MAQLPEVLTNFDLYDGSGNRTLGVVDCELPEITAKTETITGAGIGGDIEAVISGHYEAMTTTINFRSLSEESVKFLADDTAFITLRGSQQLFDSTAGRLRHQPIKVVMRVRMKAHTGGTLAQAAATGTAVELAVNYYKLTIDNKDAREIDPYNMVDKVYGVDRLAQVRKNLGR